MGSYIYVNIFALTSIPFKDNSCFWCILVSVYIFLHRNKGHNMISHSKNFHIFSRFFLVQIYAFYFLFEAYAFDLTVCPNGDNFEFSKSVSVSKYFHQKTLKITQ